MGLDKKVVEKISDNLAKYYTVYAIRKKNKKSFRTIHAPQGVLKTYQKQIARRLAADAYVNRKHAYAFLSKRSPVDNANEHVNKKYVVRIDVHDFFGSMHFKHVKRVINYFYKVNRGYCTDKDVIAISTLLCTPYGRIPQGAPTSPILSNLICKHVDDELEALEVKYNCRITRYADDFIMSGNNAKLLKSIDDIKLLLRTKLGLKINRDKTLIMKRNKRQRVTGVIVNKKTNMCREDRRRLRATVHNITADTTHEELQQIRGKIAWLVQLNQKLGSQQLAKFLSKTSSLGLKFS